MTGRPTRRGGAHVRQASAHDPPAPGNPQVVRPVPRFSSQLGRRGGREPVKASRLCVAQGHIFEAVLRFLPRRLHMYSALSEWAIFQVTFKLPRQLLRNSTSLATRGGAPRPPPLADRGVATGGCAVSRSERWRRAQMLPVPGDAVSGSSRCWANLKLNREACTRGRVNKYGLLITSGGSGEMRTSGPTGRSLLGEIPRAVRLDSQTRRHSNGLKLMAFYSV